LHFDLVINGGIIVTSNGCQKMDIGISDGIITAITKPNYLPDKSRQKFINAKGKLVIPGAVDSHVHLREPGFPSKETFMTGTKAAAAGGVTTVMVMPFTKPFVTSTKELEEKVRIAEGQSFVDYALQATIKPISLDQIKDAANWGITSFEILLAEAPEELRIIDNAVLYSIFEKVAETDSRVGIYAADDDLINKFTQELIEDHRCDFIAHYESKPQVGEALGIARACLMAEFIGTKIHFRQVSTKNGVDILREMKKHYEYISAEVSPHHLFLNTDCISKMGPFAKVNPPLGKHEDCQALWEGLKDGTIDIIASDHAPHTIEEKNNGYQNIWNAPGGIIGLQTLLPLIVDHVLRNSVSMVDLTRWLSERPARLFGLFPRKGIIKIGGDADLVIIDPKKYHIISSESQYSKAKYTPFEGKKLRGTLDSTLLRGNVIMEDGIVLKHALGKLLKPSKVNIKNK